MTFTEIIIKRMAGLIETANKDSAWEMEAVAEMMKATHLLRTFGLAQASPDAVADNLKLYDLANAIPDARFGPDYPACLVNSFEREGITGRDYCFRIARSIMMRFKVAPLPAPALPSPEDKTDPDEPANEYVSDDGQFGVGA